MLSKGIGLEIPCSILDISIYQVLKDYEMMAEIIEGQKRKNWKNLNAK